MIKMLGAMTYHAAVERKERFDFIREHMGFTSIVMEGVCNGRKYGITSGGVVIVRSAYDNVVITAFLADMDFAKFVSRLLGKKQISPNLYKRIQKNMKRYPQFFQY